ncbi:hypothetical protein Trco_003879 [Trichoderma cornu-damae]|uniref:Uncharacterized protein n=1 Tax=Trichoderma cornu-damae TaxID=654480 RepID=A0A9P8TTM8_9HYPO|nr:hypothetical protein Trco_003879 [Trichoderma cornu-damae]
MAVSCAHSFVMIKSDNTLVQWALTNMNKMAGNEATNNYLIGQPPWKAGSSGAWLIAGCCVPPPPKTQDEERVDDLVWILFMAPIMTASQKRTRFPTNHDSLSIRQLQRQNRLHLQHAHKHHAQKRHRLFSSSPLFARVSAFGYLQLCCMFPTWAATSKRSVLGIAHPHARH